MYFKASIGRFFGRESSDSCKKFKLSMNRRPPKGKLIYVSPFWGIHSSFLSFIFEISWKRRCVSYPLRLGTTRGIGSCSGLIRTFKLHAECAVPRYFPLMWQWSLTASLTLERCNGLTQYGQSSSLFLIHLFTLLSGLR